MSGHAPHADPKDPFQKRVAISLAIFTAFLAFTTMLTNQARTRSLLLSNQATNQWAYYQAKSTKGIIARAEIEILERVQGAADDPVRARLAGDIVRYEEEKTAIETEARRLTAEQHQFQHKEHWFEYSSTAIELAIVFAGVSLLFGSRALFGTSIAIAILSLAMAGWTALWTPEAHASKAAEHHEQPVTHH